MPVFEAQERRLHDGPVTMWEGGEGPALLFLHGAGGAAGMFASGDGAPFLQALARDFRVIVPEHPGFGTRPRPDWVETIHDLAYFYLDWLDREAGPVHLVGQSLGGWIALEMAVRNTRHLRSLTLAGAAGVQTRGVPKGDLFLWSREEFAEHMFHRPENVRAFLDAPATPEGQRAMLQNRETLALLAWEPRLVDPHLHKWLHRIDVPTHVIWASDDHVLPAPYGERIASLIPGSRLSVVPDSGHIVYADQPEAFAGAVSGFIRECA